MSTATVTLEADGTIRIPREILEALHLEGQQELHIEADQESGLIYLSPEDDDSWTETEEFKEKLKRALEDEAAGRYRHMNEEQLRALAPTD